MLAKYMKKISACLLMLNLEWPYGKLRKVTEIEYKTENIQIVGECFLQLKTKNIQANQRF